MLSVSTLTIQFVDPTRKLLNTENIARAGAIVSFDGREYVMVQLVKAGDQMQLVFEPKLVYMLRNKRSPKIDSGTSTHVTEFIQRLVNEMNPNPAKPKYKLVAPNYTQIWSQISTEKIYSIPLSRGTATDAYEDSWTAMSRIAGGIAWRLWEDDGTIYFGPDEYWLGKIAGVQMPINKINGTLGTKMQVIQEFTRKVQYMDFDWDVGKPLGQANVTCMLQDWNYKIGEIVKLSNVGPASGNWMVASMQRDMFLPNAAMTLMVPMPYQQVINPTTAPSQPLPKF